MTGQPREYWHRILAALHIHRRDDDFDAEFASHLEMAAEAHRRSGLTPEAARRAAAREFGSLLAAKERAGEQRGLPALESLFRDIRQGLRLLRADPRFTAAAILMLGLSIGTNTAVVTLTNAALVKGYPLVERNDRLLYLTIDPECCASYAAFEDWRSMAKSFSGMAAVKDFRRTYSDGDDSPRTYYSTEITANTFRLTGTNPLLGRDFTHADELPGAAPVVIISYRLWQDRYRGDRGVPGRTVKINDLPATIIGIMPRGFSFPQNQDLWIPMTPTPTLLNRANSSMWYVLGRLADGVSPESARAEMRAIGQRLRNEYPRTDHALPIVRTFPEFFIRTDSIRVYQAMLGAVSFLLLIACANLANLLLARSIDRARELSVRLALGASRWRIIRQLMVESLLLAAPGGVLGWAIARYGIRIYAHFADGGGLSNATGVWFANIIDYSMDSRVFLYLIAITLGTGLLFGLLPALRLFRLDIQSMLKDGGRAAAGGTRGNRLSALLIMGETALTVVLLAGSGVMIHSLLKVWTVDLGFDPSRELMVGVMLPPRYNADQALAFADKLKTRIEAAPGVEAVGIADSRPILPVLNVPYELADAPSAGLIDTAQSLAKTAWIRIMPDYFRSLGLALLSGRDFDGRDRPGSPPVVIVNRQFAEKAWPGVNPLGKRVRFYQNNRPMPWHTVIGVAPDTAHGDFSNPLYRFLPQVYLPYRQQRMNSLTVTALASVPPSSLAGVFYRELHGLDPALPIGDVPQTVADFIGQMRRYHGTVSVLFLIFAAVALFLASVGLYSVIAHSVARRTQEIGVRIAIGAPVTRILRLVASQAITPVIAGLAAGLLASLALNRLLGTFIVGVSPSDPMTLVGAAVTLLVCAAFGCLIPAARASRIDPAHAIRYE
ncbi:MAG TPA: ABC transporter permease [Bryobacteraceae bacterium]|nr:ABC transporter permease [Bryobacteraceae bacterium]